MSWPAAIVLIVLICTIAGVMRRRSGARRRDRHTEDQTPSLRELELEEEVSQLRERVQVLERIATDHNSIDATETRRIAEEIEALRGRQDKPAD